MSAPGAPEDHDMNPVAKDKGPEVCEAPQASAEPVGPSPRVVHARLGSLDYLYPERIRRELAQLAGLETEGGPLN